MLFKIFCMVGRIGLFVTLWTIAHQIPLSMGFSWQKYWNGLPFPSSGDLPSPGIKPMPPAWQVGSLPLSHQGIPTVVHGGLKINPHIYHFLFEIS